MVRRLSLPAGEYTVTYGRGPEYITGIPKH